MRLEKLFKYEKEFSLINEISAGLHWDQSTIMPETASDQRSEQMSYLATLEHNKITSKEYVELIQSLWQDKEQLTKLERAIVRERHQEIQDSLKVPVEFVEECEKAAVEGYSAWLRAKKENDYGLFKPCLEKHIKLVQRYAEYMGMSPFDAALYSCDEHLPAKKIKELFDNLKPGLIDLIDKIKPKELKPLDSFYHIEHQKILCRKAMELIGVDLNRGTVADTAHPFMITLSKDDKRIGMAYRTNNLWFGLSSAIHEGGHCIYEQGLPNDVIYTCLHNVPCMTLHESQSRLYETMIGQSWEFCNMFFPTIGKYFNLQGFSAEDFYNHINHVQPSLIRIEADEVTYCLHIIIRFELEYELLEGNLTVDELPGAWDDKYEKYLGIRPKNISNGVLQDVHWAEGMFGYFQSYALGNMLAAMIMDKMNDSFNVFEDIKNANFDRIKSWLNTNIHNKGLYLQSQDLIEDIFGHDIVADNYLKYLRVKYLET